VGHVVDFDGLDGRLAALHLPAHEAVLRALVERAATDPRVDWVELGGSLAEGRGDALSDLDLGLGVTTSETAFVTDLLADLGPTIALHPHDWSGSPRWWVVYASGLQVDLVALPAESRPGRAPGALALVDKSGRLATEFRPRLTSAPPAEVERWAFDGWEALGNVAKYLARGSLHEALDQLARARTDVLRLWAAAEGVRYPAFGLTSLLDDPDAHLPGGLDATYATARADELHAAALATAGLLVHATARTTAQVPPALVEHVRAHLWRGGARPPIVEP
jgi:hypothetical protein